MCQEESLSIAEQYLQEMLDADDSADFDLYTQRYEPKYLAHFTKEKFMADIVGMQQRNGHNVSYELLGTLRSSDFDGHKVFRSVWKGVYEKRDAVIEIGVYKLDGQWYIIQSSVH